MQSETKSFLQAVYYQNMQANKQRKAKLYNSYVKTFNKRPESVYNFGIDNVYSISKLHSLINWYKYFIDYNLRELIHKYDVINGNKIEL